MPPPYSSSSSSSSLLSLWSPSSVYAQLVDHGISSSDAHTLRQQDIDGLALIQLTHEHLEKMGINTFGRRNRILALATMMREAADRQQAVEEAEMLHTQHTHTDTITHTQEVVREKEKQEEEEEQHHHTRKWKEILERPLSAFTHHTQNRNTSLLRQRSTDTHTETDTPTIQERARENDRERTHGEKEAVTQRIEQIRSRRRAEREQHQPQQHYHQHRHHPESAFLLPGTSSSIHTFPVPTELFSPVPSSARHSSHSAYPAKEERNTELMKQRMLITEKQRLREAEAEIEFQRQTAKQHSERINHQIRQQQQEEKAWTAGYYSDGERDSRPIRSPVSHTHPSPPASPALPRIETAAASPSLPADLSPPSSRLELEWVYGYQCRSTRSNVVVNCNGCLIYPCASVGVVLHKEGSIGTAHRQTHFLGHDGTIRCLTQHPINLNIIATGQDTGHRSRQDRKTQQTVLVPTNPCICIWDSSDVTRSLSIPLDAADVSVTCLSFTGDGQFVVSLSLNAQHTMRVWRWSWVAASQCAAVHTSADLIYQLKCNHKNPQELVTVGRNHIAFWYWNGHTIKGRKAVIPTLASSTQSSPVFYCVAFSSKGFACVGSNTGTVHIYTDVMSAPRVFAVHSPETKILCMDWFPDGLVTGGNDGQIIITDKKLKVIKRVKFSNKVCSAYLKGNTDMVVGTQGGNIYTTDNLWDEQITHQHHMHLAVAGHCEGELTALAATHPNHPTDSTAVFVTTGQDNTVRLWDANTHRLLNTAHLTPAETQQATADAATPLAARSSAVCISPRTQMIIVGTDNSQLLLFSPELKLLSTSSLGKAIHLYHMQQKQQHTTQTESNETGLGRPREDQGITVLSLSPDGLMMAIGLFSGMLLFCSLTHADALCVVKHILHLHRTAITAIDWSGDQRHLLVTDAAFNSIYISMHRTRDLTSLQPVPSSTAETSAAIVTLHNTWFDSYSTPLSFPTHTLFSPSEASLVHTKMAAYTPDSVRVSKRKTHAAAAETAKEESETGAEQGLLVVSSSDCLSLYRWTGLCRRHQQPIQCLAHKDGYVGGLSWLRKGNALITIGQRDLSVMQWKVV